MRLLSTQDILAMESVLAAGAKPNSLRVRDPERFPFIHEVLETLMEKNLKNGYLYRYLVERFEGHANCAGWQIYSLGPAGRQMSKLLEEVREHMQDPSWVEEVERRIHGKRWPVRERVVLAWLENRVPDGLLSTPAPDARRLFSTYDSRFRRMFRGQKRS